MAGHSTATRLSAACARNATPGARSTMRCAAPASRPRWRRAAAPSGDDPRARVFPHAGPELHGRLSADLRRQRPHARDRRAGAGQRGQGVSGGGRAAVRRPHAGHGALSRKGRGGRISRGDELPDRGADRRQVPQRPGRDRDGLCARGGRARAGVPHGAVHQGVLHHARRSARHGGGRRRQHHRPFRQQLRRHDRIEDRARRQTPPWRAPPPSWTRSPAGSPTASSPATAARSKPRATSRASSPPNRASTAMSAAPRRSGSRSRPRSSPSRGSSPASGLPKAGGRRCPNRSRSAFSRRSTASTRPRVRVRRAARGRRRAQAGRSLAPAARAPRRRSRVGRSGRGGIGNQLGRARQLSPAPTRRRP